MKVHGNLEYKFYQRKDSGISNKELDWIDVNLPLIAKSENVLFAYQAEYETLLLTSEHIYFPNRTELRRLSYNQIKKIKIVGDALIEIVTDEKTAYCIILTDAVSKVKLFKVLELLKENCSENKDITFEDAETIFEEVTIVKFPPKQDQHKLPQVYLKQFGYKKGEKWVVSVLDRSEDFTRQKSIKSFTATTNVFDIKSEDDRIARVFENINCELENEYLGIINDIESNGFISEKSKAYLLQILPNFMARSDYWREFVKMMLESENKENFLKVTLMFTVSSDEEFEEIESKDYYKLIADGEVDDDKINRALIHFTQYLFSKIKYWEVVILEAPEEKWWFTSDNPVIFIGNHEEGRVGICGPDSEFYLPLSKKYLAYFHFKRSELIQPIFRTLENKKVFKILDIISEDEYDKFVKEIILDNKSQIIIFPLEMDWKREITDSDKKTEE